jgi:hypothetical protein
LAARIETGTSRDDGTNRVGAMPADKSAISAETKGMEAYKRAPSSDMNGAPIVPEDMPKAAAPLPAEHADNRRIKLIVLSR